MHQWRIWGGSTEVPAGSALRVCPSKRKLELASSSLISVLQGCPDCREHEDTPHGKVHEREPTTGTHTASVRTAEYVGKLNAQCWKNRSNFHGPKSHYKPITSYDTRRACHRIFLNQVFMSVHIFLKPGGEKRHIGEFQRLFCMLPVAYFLDSTVNLVTYLGPKSLSVGGSTWTLRPLNRTEHWHAHAEGGQCVWVPSG